MLFCLEIVVRKKLVKNLEDGRNEHECKLDGDQNSLRTLTVISTLTFQFPLIILVVMFFLISYNKKCL